MFPVIKYWPIVWEIASVDSIPIRAWSFQEICSLRKTSPFGNFIFRFNYPTDLSSIKYWMTQRLKPSPLNCVSIRHNHLLIINICAKTFGWIKSWDIYLIDVETQNTDYWISFGLIANWERIVGSIYCLLILLTYLFKC